MSAGRTRFLQRRSYRRRRVADAARLLPLAGLILLMLPLLRLGAASGEAAARTSQVGLYIFGVWIILMAVAYGLSRGLHAAGEDPEDPDPRQPEDPEA